MHLNQSAMLTWLFYLISPSHSQLLNRWVQKQRLLWSVIDYFSLRAPFQSCGKIKTWATRCSWKEIENANVAKCRQLVNQVEHCFFHFFSVYWINPLCLLLPVFPSSFLFFILLLLYAPPPCSHNSKIFNLLWDGVLHYIPDWNKTYHITWSSI